MHWALSCTQPGWEGAPRGPGKARGMGCVSRCAQQVVLSPKESGTFLALLGLCPKGERSKQGSCPTHSPGLPLG